MTVDPRSDAARFKVGCQALDALGILSGMGEEDLGFSLATIVVLRDGAVVGKRHPGRDPAGPPCPADGRA